MVPINGTVTVGAQPHSLNWIPPLWIVVAVCLLAQNMRDSMDVASNVYQLVIENDKVRVLKVTFQPGDTAAMHHHPDHVIYVLRGGRIKLTSEGKTDVLDLETGKAMFLNAQSHEAENVGGTVLDLLVVELKK
jgi:quercetin dioxygenase-like cupin family protein